MNVRVRTLVEEWIIGPWVKTKEISSGLEIIHLATGITQFRNFLDLPQSLNEFL
jgi:hypothetical protein